MESKENSKKVQANTKIDVAKTAVTPNGRRVIQTERMPTIRRGCSGYAVRIWQKIIGVNVDGDFGFKTEAATKAWQTSHELASDGVVGKDTWFSAGYKIKGGE